MLHLFTYTMPNKLPIYRVSRFVSEARSLLEASYPGIRIEGEISNLAQPASGHKYFTLKDETAQVRCAMFRNRARFAFCKLAEGQHVIITARVSLYEARGEFQCIVQSVEDAGEGQLRLRFEQLKKRLADEGLFDAAKKTVPPEMPGRIGIITSPSGAAVHDIITTFRRRFPAIPLLIYPVTVQGDTAAADIATALQTANARNECDVLILARGGGTLEDLWPFNEEIVARAVYASRIPVISAVGHETDFSISDMVADARAATPTAAAEMLSPDQDAVLNQIQNREKQLLRSVERTIENAAQRVDFALRHLQHPEMSLRNRKQHLRQLQLRLGQTTRSQLARQRAASQLAKQRLADNSPGNKLIQASQALALTREKLVNGQTALLKDRHSALANSVQTLHVLSPLATLARGYATLHNPHDNKPVTSVTMVSQGESITARLGDGELDCLINQVNKKE